MLVPDTRLRPNGREIAAKVLDGEAIIINLSDGTYYSMELVGGLIWTMIDRGHSLGEIASSITASYDVEPDRAMADLRRLVDELLAEALVVVTDGPPPTLDAPAEPAARLPYEPPLISSYRDLADLFALDPPMPRIEDVAWQSPSRRA